MLQSDKFIRPGVDVTLVPSETPLRDPKDKSTDEAEKTQNKRG